MIKFHYEQTRALIFNEIQIEAWLSLSLIQIYVIL
jgi:hypothetical protein